MSPEERRDEIVAAALPLLATHGANVTTSQIAQAAGIAEGTIFRAFKDKRELLVAALSVAMSADAEVARIGEIPSSMDLSQRLVAALGAVSDYQDRMWSLLRVGQECGWHPGHAGMGEDENHPKHQMQRIGVAIAALFRADNGTLRIDPSQAARMLLGMAFTSRMQEQGMETSVTAEQLVDLFLNGARAEDA